MNLGIPNDLVYFNICFLNGYDIFNDFLRRQLKLFVAYFKVTNIKEESKLIQYALKLIQNYVKFGLFFCKSLCFKEIISVSIKLLKNNIITLWLIYTKIKGKTISMFKVYLLRRKERSSLSRERERQQKGYLFNVVRTCYFYFHVSIRKNKSTSKSLLRLSSATKDATIQNN